jgi:hypothetical protein
MGRALGLYGEDTEHNLNLLRQIRNAFAHSHAPITFQTKEVAAAVDLFRPIPILPPYTMGADKKPIPEEPRAKFHHLVLAYILAGVSQVTEDLTARPIDKPFWAMRPTVAKVLLYGFAWPLSPSLKRSLRERPPLQR